MNTIAVVGAGIVGLAVTRSLVDAGYQVQLFDPGAPGEGTSLGNAGLIANYATSPMASIGTLKALPRELVRRDASLSIDPRYLSRLASFGPRFIQAATPSRFARHKADLVALIQDAVKAQHRLLESLDAPGLYADTGCLQLAYRGDALSQSLEASAAAKRADGVDCQALTAADVRDLEPELSPERLEGALFFPSTRHLKDPLAVSRTLWRRLERAGAVLHRARIEGLAPCVDGGWRLVSALGEHHADQVVMCAGMANQALMKWLGMSLPVVSERGYHVRARHVGLADTTCGLAGPPFLRHTDGGRRAPGGHHRVYRAGTACRPAPLGPPEGMGRRDVRSLSDAERALDGRSPFHPGWFAGGRSRGRQGRAVSGLRARSPGVDPVRPDR